VVYLITDRRQTGGRPLGEVVARALGALGTGANRARSVAVQLREKDLPGRELHRLALELRAITTAAGVRLFVNDRADVALAVGADGVQLGQGALDLDDVSAVAPGLAIGVSTHTVAEVEGLRGDARVAFAVFGPVHDTPSKRSYGPPVGVDRLRDACVTGVPVVAVGGIDAARARSCLAAGASGVACIRAVLAAAAPDRALASIFEAIEST
jgi:thiamine-phosphate pyrophosphorylase